MEATEQKRCGGSGYVPGEDPPPPGVSMPVPISLPCPGCEDCRLAVRATGYGASKHHIADSRDALALCGATSGLTPHHWSHAGELAAFREHAPHRLCKRCEAKK